MGLCLEGLLIILEFSGLYMYVKGDLNLIIIQVSLRILHVIVDALNFKHNNVNKLSSTFMR